MSSPVLDAFKTGVIDAFGKSAERKQEAEQKLSARHQVYQETFASYVEYVLSLYRRVDSQVSERDKAQHLLKGLSEHLLTLSLCKLLRLWPNSARVAVNL